MSRGISALIMFWAATALAGEDHSHLPVGGRKALHGMVLYGQGTYFLDHIPITEPPHDFQVVARVTLTVGGQPVTKDFSKNKFTFKPSSHFSLNDYVAGRHTSFEGEIHKGSFEHQPSVVPGFAVVKVKVEEIKLARKIPAESPDSVFEVSDAKNTFVINIITPERNVQEISVKGRGRLWCVTGPEFFEFCP